MREVILGSQFKRDVKLAEKRGKDMSKLRTLVLLLAEGAPLPPRYRDHALSGDWKHFRDCHIEPDWLLIYKIDGNDLYLTRTGTHADLF
ncbi:MAG TPA: type II toxin-antitoxin system YafQ family toxin [Acidobacteriaceae bacterium]|nr:type II toxin-antitoxin system YafQ family toxin [Acidobacteriaceae bacterium]